VAVDLLARQADEQRPRLGPARVDDDRAGDDGLGVGAAGQPAAGQRGDVGEGQGDHAGPLE
jgi:hypothetical protein